MLPGYPLPLRNPSSSLAFQSGWRSGHCVRLCVISCVTVTSKRQLREFCLMLEINEFRCYEVKIEKAGSHQESRQSTLVLRESPPVS